MTRTLHDADHDELEPTSAAPTATATASSCTQGACLRRVLQCSASTASCRVDCGSRFWSICLSNSVFANRQFSNIRDAGRKCARPQRNKRPHSMALAMRKRSTKIHAEARHFAETRGNTEEVAGSQFERSKLLLDLMKRMRSEREENGQLTQERRQDE